MQDYCFFTLFIFSMGFLIASKLRILCSKLDIINWHRDMIYLACTVFLKKLNYAILFAYRFVNRKVRQEWKCQRGFHFTYVFFFPLEKDLKQI